MKVDFFALGSIILTVVFLVEDTSLSHSVPQFKRLNRRREVCICGLACL